MFTPGLFSGYSNGITINNATLKLVKNADSLALVVCPKDEQSLSQARCLELEDWFNQISGAECWKKQVR